MFERWVWWDLLNRRKSGHWQYCPWRVLWVPGPFSSLFFASWTPQGKQASSNMWPCSPFKVYQAFTGLDDNHLRGGNNLYSLYWISTGNIPTDTPRKHSSLVIWAFLCPVKLTYKMHPYTDINTSIFLIFMVTKKSYYIFLCNFTQKSWDLIKNPTA